MPRLEGDVLEMLAAATEGDLTGRSLTTSQEAVVTVVLAAGDYPERGDRGTPIEGIEDAEAAGALVFHAGTALHDGRLVTNGGRILNVTALGPTIADARSRAYDAAGRIAFAGVRYRSDIAAAHA
jgi:phosphoribosylamine--glycine ligase